MSGSLFQILGRIFRDNGVRPILVGGYAVISQGVQRTTFDVDFIMTVEDCRRLEKDVLGLGYAVVNRREAFVQYKNSSSGLRDLDFLLTDAATIDKLVSSGSSVEIAGEKFTVPQPLHLIAMKLHALAQNPEREFKDLQDVVALMRLNRIDPASDAVKQVFVKYDALRFHEKVISLVGGAHGS